MTKYIKYFKYLLKHKWYVMIECFKHGLIWRGIMHDMSKFLPSEFIPYANYFYYEIPEERNFPSFNVAWLKHQHRNKHHWQYWILTEDDGYVFCLRMPRKHLVEMYCDWVGAGKALGSKLTVGEWYKQNKENISLYSGTRWYLERHLLEMRDL